MAKSHFRPIQAGEKIETIVSTLKQLILEGKLPSGSDLPSERELATQLNVSRYSLREALRAAQAHGLIQLRQGKRPRVLDTTSEAAREVFGIAMRLSNVRLSDLITARISLERDIAAAVAERTTDELLLRLESLNNDMEHHQDDIPFCAEKDYEFHDTLVEASGNPVFKMMLDPVAHHLRNSRLTTLRLTGIERALIGHRNIIEALRQKNPERAREAMQGHLQMAEEDIARVEQKEAKAGK
jgi:GntR family transcriptional regulator, transcriptional repressor for pyruvate dehydrogenase complex